MGGLDISKVEDGFSVLLVLPLSVPGVTRKNRRSLSIQNALKIPKGERGGTECLVMSLSYDLFHKK